MGEHVVTLDKIINLFNEYSGVLGLYEDAISLENERFEINCKQVDNAVAVYVKNLETKGEGTLSFKNETDLLYFLKCELERFFDKKGTQMSLL